MDKIFNVIKDANKTVDEEIYGLYFRSEEGKITINITKYYFHVSTHDTMEEVKKAIMADVKAHVQARAISEYHEVTKYKLDI